MARRRPNFMSLFAPWEYNLERLTFVGKRVDGLFSDSHWALAPWIEMNPSLNAYAPSMIEREYFKSLTKAYLTAQYKLQLPEQFSRVNVKKRRFWQPCTL